MKFGILIFGFTFVVGECICKQETGQDDTSLKSKLKTSFELFLNCSNESVFKVLIPAVLWHGRVI